jgi:cell division protein FtsN
MASRKPTPRKRGASRRRRTAPAPARGVPGWLWALVGLVAGFLLAQHQHGTAPWQEGHDSPLAKVVPRLSSEDASEPSRESAQEEPPMPTFEFYTLLPESEVIAPGSEVPGGAIATPPGVEPPDAPGDGATDAAEVDDPIARVIAANALSEDDEEADEGDPRDEAEGSDGERYMLQAGSFRDADDADALGGRLGDFGLQAAVSEVQAGDDETWYRVQVGPYDDTRELNRAQDLMTTQGIEPLVLRLQD